ncbi:MAG: hypothetical protein AAF401_14990 [Pseudomonadota bacterium]
MFRMIAFACVVASATPAFATGAAAPLYAAVRCSAYMDAASGYVSAMDRQAGVHARTLAIEFTNVAETLRRAYSASGVEKEAIAAARMQEVYDRSHAEITLAMERMTPEDVAPELTYDQALANDANDRSLLLVENCFLLQAQLKQRG